MGLLNKFRGCLFGILLFLSSFLGILFFAGWSLPFAFIRPKLYRYLLDFKVGFWCCYCASLLEFICGIKVVITGDEMKKGEKSLMIMNHRTRLDWMYLWSVLVRQSGTFTEKIILKSPLKHIPGAGWAMQGGAFIFIGRKWEEDQIIMKDMLDYFANLKHKTQVLLFPEGTDLCQYTKASSDKFANKNGLKTFEYVLHPRLTGFTFIAEKMRQADQLDAIYDLTVAYPHNFPQSEPQLLSGNFPQEVHFHIKRHPVSTIPINKDGLEDWCRARWQEKENQLEKFYRDKKFFERKGQGDTSLEVSENRRSGDLMLKVAFCLWTAFIVFIIWQLTYCTFLWWIGIFQIIMYLGMGKYGGFEIFLAKQYNKSFGSKEKAE